MLEAEVKLRLDDDARDRLVARLEARGARLLGESRQCDEYYAHPGRDFSQTDEALRLREVDGALRITYKGPKLDPPRKTREEIEFSLCTDRDVASRLLSRLGFDAVSCVTKRRREFRLPDGPGTVVCIDHVENLGWFCEIEVEAETVEEGRERLTARLDELGLGELDPIAQSYLELLLGRSA
jgi:adenylate cyclase, class 2